MKKAHSFEILSIQITGDSTVTVAEIMYKIDDLVLSVTGSARRHPEDSFNSTVGENLALARAFSSLGKKLEKRTIGRTRHIEMFLSKNARLRNAQRKAARTHVLNTNIASTISDVKPHAPRESTFSLSSV